MGPSSKKHDSQIEKLDKKINNLKKALRNLSDTAELDALLKVIHSPGWTTLREVALSAAYVDSITAHAVALHHGKITLLHGAKTASSGD